MKVLITGGAGYLGSVVTGLLLERGHLVTAFDSLLQGGRGLLPHLSHPHFRFVQGDIRDADTLGKVMPGHEAVIHLAAIVGDPAGRERPDLTRTTNLDGSLELWNAACRWKCQKFLFASTCSNYGSMLGDTLLGEDSDLRPLSLYAETKVMFEKHLMGHQGHLIPTIFRFSTLFGLSPRMRFDLTINHFTRDLFESKSLAIFAGNTWRPYVHVRDSARAIAGWLDREGALPYRVFNVGDNSNQFTKAQLAKTIQSLLGSGSLVETACEPDPRNYRVDFSRLQVAFDFAAQKSIVDGVNEIALALKTGAIS